MPVCGLCLYRHGVPELIGPTARLHAAWLEAHEEWGPGVHEDGFGLEPEDEVGSASGFADWVARPACRERAGRAGCTCRWIVEDGRVLGGIASRHEPGPFGDIGYGVRPSARGRGLATWALGRMPAEARALGLERVLLVCADDNLASARTIERNGGVLEEVRDTGLGPARHYRIALRPA